MQIISRFKALVIVIQLFAVPVVFASTARLMSHPAIDDALRSIKMTRDDLALNRDYVERDAFRLSLIDRFFDDPLLVPSAVEYI